MRHLYHPSVPDSVPLPIQFAELRASRSAWPADNNLRVDTNDESDRFAFSPRLIFRGLSCEAEVRCGHQLLGSRRIPARLAYSSLFARLRRRPFKGARSGLKCEGRGGKEVHPLNRTLSSSR